MSRKAKYPWDEWLDGSIVLIPMSIVKSEYQSSESKIRAAATVPAKKRGLVCAVRMMRGTTCDWIMIQSAPVNRTMDHKEVEL